MIVHPESKVNREIFVLSRLSDKGDRRSGLERRKFCYTACLPERRLDTERRAVLTEECIEDVLHIYSFA